MPGSTSFSSSSRSTSLAASESRLPRTRASSRSLAMISSVGPRPTSASRSVSSISSQSEALRSPRAKTARRAFPMPPDDAMRARRRCMRLRTASGSSRAGATASVSSAVATSSTSSEGGVAGAGFAFSAGSWGADFPERTARTITATTTIKTRAAIKSPSGVVKNSVSVFIRYPLLSSRSGANWDDTYSLRLPHPLRGRAPSHQGLPARGLAPEADPPGTQMRPARPEQVPNR